MIRRNFALGLSSRDGRYLALRVSRGETKPYRVDWLETLPAEAPGGAPCWKELLKSVKQTSFLIPTDTCTLVQARLPELKPAEIQQALLSMIQKLKNGAPGHWLIDYFRRPASEDAPATPQTVTALCLERPMLASLLDALDEAARPQHALPAAIALDELLRWDLARGEEEPGIWNLVHVGGGERFLVISDTRGPRLLRALPPDLSDGGDGDEYIDRLLTEVERSNFFAQQGDAGGRVDQVLVAGDPALADALQEKLAAGDGPPARRWRPEQLFELDGDGTVAWQQLLPLAGAAAMLEGPRFNVMPRMAETSHGRRLAGYALYMGLAAGLALIPLLGGGSFSTNRVQERALRRQSETLSESRLIAEASARAYLKNLNLLERQGQVDDFGGPRANLAGALSDIVSRMPGAVQLQDLELTQESTGTYSLVLYGECQGPTAENAQARFLEFHCALADSPYLVGGEDPTMIEIKPDEQSKQGVSSLVSFIIEYRLREESAG